jgi:hypothetical protein
LSLPLIFPTTLAARFVLHPIFDPGVACQSGDRYLFLDSLRSVSLELFLADDGDAMDFFLHGWIVSTPKLLTELFVRLTGMSTTFSQKIVSHTRLLAALLEIAVTYRNFEIDVDEQARQLVRKVRTTLFSMLAHLFVNKRVLELVCTDSLNVASFVSFIFEESLRNFVVQAIRQFALGADAALAFPSSRLTARGVVFMRVCGCVARMAYLPPLQSPAVVCRAL